MCDRGIDRGVDLVDPHSSAQERVEQTRHPWATGPDVRSHRRPDLRRMRRHAARTSGEHGTTRVRFAQRGQGSAGGWLAVDDDRGERLAERRLDRLLPAVVDLDQVEQRAEHAVDSGQSLCSRAGVGGVERQLQRLDAGVRT